VPVAIPASLALSPFRRTAMFVIVPVKVFGTVIVEGYPLVALITVGNDPVTEILAELVKVV
jgi:hypothetical protein